MDAFKCVTLYAKDMLTVDIALKFAIEYIKKMDETSKALGLNLPNLADDEIIEEMEKLRKRMYVDA